MKPPSLILFLQGSLSLLGAEPQVLVDAVPTAASWAGSSGKSPDEVLGRPVPPPPRSAP